MESEGLIRRIGRRGGRQRNGRLHLAQRVLARQAKRGKLCLVVERQEAHAEFLDAGDAVITAGCSIRCLGSLTELTLRTRGASGTERLTSPAIGMYSLPLLI